MVSSTFGRRTAFHPTPSTCYPPPPPPPLPYDVPCLRGQPRFVMQARGTITVVQGPPFDMRDVAIPFVGVPVQGSAGGFKNWTLNIATPTIITMTAQLICGRNIAGSSQWFATCQGMLLTPAAAFCSVEMLRPENEPEERSQPEGYNDIRATIPLVGGPYSGWTPTTAHIQWFTAGAPEWKP